MSRTVTALLVLLVCAGARQVEAAVITFGTRIDLTPDTFVLPIEIEEALNLTEWSFDLTYDPDDIQINTGCDPFSGDLYCSLLTGPVTEGDFFASGAPFNLLVPGFIQLDPISLAQTGLLFGAHGAFGGIGPGPSGNGTIAFVEFIRMGDGDTTPDVSDPTAVPEPTTMALFGIGLLLSGAWSRRRRRVFTIICLAVGSWAASGRAEAQITEPPIFDDDLPIAQLPPPAGYPATVALPAAGGYFSVPAWNQTLAPNVRFVILSNLNSDAVLDRETGLVWARQSSTNPTTGSSQFTFSGANSNCKSMVVGARGGWRLPSEDELMTLIDFSRPVISGDVARLPAGHPFALATSASSMRYWVSDVVEGIGHRLVSLYSGSVVNTGDHQRMLVLCVRGRR